MEIDPELLKRMLRDLFQEARAEAEADVADKWANGTLIFKPRDPSLKEHEIPIRTFFRKVISVREKLRVLEQKINNSESLSDEEKINLEGYISRCYGSLTSFNFLRLSPCCTTGAAA